MKKNQLEQKEYLNDLVENSLNEILIFDAISLKFLYANRGALKNLRYEFPELQNLTPIDIKPDFNKEEFLSLLEPLYNDEKEIVNLETRHMRKDGTDYFVSANIQKIDFKGESAFAVIIFNITDKVKTEQELIKSEKQLIALFSAMTEMVVQHELVFDEDKNPIDYRILDCNDAFTKVTGITHEQAVGKLATEVYNSKTAPYFEEFSNVALTGKEYQFDTYYPQMDKHFSISVVSPEKNHFATVTTDITQIKEYDEYLMQKNDELENYLYIASHDLRSPLVNVNGFSQRIKKDISKVLEIIESDPTQEEIKNAIDKVFHEKLPKSLDFIFTNIEKMDILLKGLLQLSRTGRVEMTMQEVDMNSLLSSIVKSNQFQLDEFNGSVNISSLPSCMGDMNLLNQLFSNLIANSINYRSPERDLLIEITGTKYNNKSTYCVKDNGVGIHEKFLKKIWDIFYRVDPRSSIYGEGLGLSIVKRIAEKHNGKVKVESEVDVGTKFYLELKAKK